MISYFKKYLYSLASWKAVKKAVKAVKAVKKAINANWNISLKVIIAKGLSYTSNDSLTPSFYSLEQKKTLANTLV